MENKKKLFYGWVIVIGAVLIGAATNLLSTIGNIVIGDVTAEFNSPRAMFNVATILSMPVVMILSPISGRYYRNKPKKIVMLSAAAIFGLALFCCAFAKNLYWFFVLVPLAGAMTAFVNNVPVSTIINNWFIDKKGLAIGIAGAGVPLASMVTTPLISWLVESTGWRRAYAYVGIGSAALLLLVILFIIQFRPEQKGLLPLGYKAAEEEEETPKAETVVIRKGVMLRDAKKTLPFYLFLFSLLLVGIAASGTSSSQYVYLTDSGYTPAYASLVVSVSSGIGIVGRILLGYLFDKKGVKFSTVYSMGVLVIAEIALLAVKLPISPWILAVSYGLGGAVNQIPRSILPAKYFGDIDYGNYLGIATSLQMCGVAAGSVVASAFYDAMGTYVYAWYLFIGMFVATAAIWIYCDIAKEKLWEKYEQSEDSAAK